MLLTLALPILFLVFLECLLSFDNALVLAAMVRHLPKPMQARALTYGVWGAYIFRVIALTGLVFVLKYDIVRLIGGGYLVWLALSHFLGLSGGTEDDAKAGQFSFWRTVVAVEIADMAFSMDSIMAGAGFTQNLLVIIAGGLIGISCMRMAAYVFVRLLGIFPRLETTAFLLVAVVGIRLIFDCFFSMPDSAEQFTVYALMGLSVMFGLTRRVKDRSGNASIP